MANDFTTDPDVAAVWPQEDGDLGGDLIGGNDLTVGGGMASSVDAMEGSYSGYYDNGSGAYMYMTNAALDAGFLFKQGDTSKVGTILGWFKHSTTGANDGIYCMDDSGKYCLRIRVDADDDLECNIGYSGGTLWEELKFDGGSSPITQDVWFHFAWSYDDSDRSYRIRLYNDNTKAQHASDTVGNYTNNINVEDSGLTIGAYSGAANKWYGYLDELVVVKRVLTPSEIDQIRDGTYAGRRAPRAHYLAQRFRRA